jgi:ABC-2 type transport system ATP-binding protein
MSATNNGFAVEIKNLVKDFRVGIRGVKLRAVDNLTLRVPENCIYGLIGPNGSGKSTTLKILLGLTTPTSGECSLYGHAAGSMAARALSGYLPEAPYFYRHLSGRELVHFYARISLVPPSEIEERVDNVLAIVGLAAAASRRTGTYSKGMLQRLGLAQALVHDPKLVILDEPTAGVDPVGSADFGKILMEMKQRGKTVIICSHLLGQMEELCDRVAMLDKGRLVIEGTIDAVLSRPGRRTLTVEGLDDEAIAAVEAVLARHGARIESIGSPRESLEKLFLEKTAASQPPEQA